MTHAESCPVDQPPASKATNEPPCKKRRRWLRVLTVVLVLLAILVVASPYLLSTGPGTRLVVAIANRQLRGRIEMDDLSLGWGSSTQISGLRLYDRRGRLVVDTSEVTAQLGVWAAMTSPEAFGELAVRSANITLYETEQGGFSMANVGPAPGPAEPEEPAEPGPEPNGRIVIDNASVEIVRLDGRRLRITDINTTVDVASSQRISGQSSFRLASGGRMDIAYRLDEPGSGDVSSTVEVALATPEPVDLQPVLVFAAGRDVAGHLTLDGQVVRRGNTGQADVTLRIERLRADVKGRRVDPMDVTLTVDGRLDANGADGTVSLGTSAGKATLQLALNDLKAWQRMGGEALAAAAVDGEAISLPRALVSGHANIDLSRIARALPGLIDLAQQADLTGGQLTSEFEIVTGPATRDSKRPLTAVGELHLKNVTVRRPDPAPGESAVVRWAPTDSTFDVAIVTGEGLRVNQAELTSGFVTATAKGALNDFTAMVNVDLGAAQQLWSSVVDMGEPTLAGRVVLTAGGIARDTTRIPITVNTTVSNVRLSSADHDVTLDSAELLLPLVIRRPGETLQRVAWDGAELTVNRQATVAMSGAYNRPASTVRAAVDIDNQDVASLVALARTFGADVPGEMAGRLTLHGDCTAPTHKTGRLAAAFEMTLADLDLRQDDRRVRLASLSLQEGTVAYDYASRQSQANVGIDGRALQVVTRTGRDADASIQTLAVPSLSGSVSAGTGETTTVRHFSVDVTAGDVAINRDGRDIPFGTAEVVLDATADDASKVVRISEMRFTSPPLTVQLTGENTIADYENTRQLSLQGTFEGQWDRVMELVYAVKPSLDDEDAIVVRFTGPLAPAGSESGKGTFTATGPARQPNVRPVFRNVDASTAIGWTSGSVAGIELGQAVIRPTLEQGRLVIQAEPIPASGGTLRPGGAVDFTGEDPVYRLPGEMRLIENVTLKPEVGTQLLSRFNPVFAKLVGLEGTMSLSVRDLVLPLGEAIKTGGSGSGHLDLSMMSVKSRSGLLDALVGMWGAASGEFQKVRVEGVDFAIRDGRIHYDNVRMIFGKDVDMIFHGSVGFDDTLDLWVSVPVHAGVLEAFKVEGAVLDITRVLQRTGVRIEIPIQGTRLAPRLRLDRQRIDKLVGEALKAMAEEQARNALLDIMQQGLDGGD
ncbi:MAG: hypothetical protein GVY16_07485 [Planctomycetes bacterium]|nr:hypothetical protein [Planctomycetota bacterium]